MYGSPIRVNSTRHTRFDSSRTTGDLPEPHSLRRLHLGRSTNERIDPMVLIHRPHAHTHVQIIVGLSRRLRSLKSDSGSPLRPRQADDEPKRCVVCTRGAVPCSSCLGSLFARIISQFETYWLATTQQQRLLGVMPIPRRFLLRVQ